MSGKRPMRRLPDRRATRSNPLSDTRALDGRFSRLRLGEPSLEERLSALEREWSSIKAQVETVKAQVEKLVSWDMEDLSIRLETDIKDAETRLTERFQATVESVKARDDQLDKIEHDYNSIYWDIPDVREKLEDAARRIQKLEDRA